VPFIYSISFILQLNHFAYGLIERRGKKLNPEPFLGLLKDNDTKELPDSFQDTELERVAA